VGKGRRCVPSAELEGRRSANTLAGFHAYLPGGSVDCRALYAESTHGALGYPRRRVSSCFHPRRGFLDPTVLRLSRTGFILSCPLSSTECLRRPSSPLLSERHVLPRVSSLIAALPKVSTSAGGSQLPLRSVLRFSQPLDGFRHLRLRGPITSRSHVQGSSVQGFLPSHSRP